MRFSIRTKDQKLQEKKLRLRKWHKKFAWLPTRMSNDENVVVFLEFMLRRGIPSTSHRGKLVWDWKYAESAFDVLKNGDNV